MGRKYEARDIEIGKGRGDEGVRKKRGIGSG